MLSKMKISKPTIYLCGFFIVTQFINGFNDAGSSSSEISRFWYVAAFYWALNWWFIADARSYSAGWKDVYLDMSMFLYIAGFFVIPYYLFKTRGWKAFYTIVLFLGSILGTYILGSLFSLIMRLF